MHTTEPLSLYYDLCRNRSRHTAFRTLLRITINDVREVAKTVGDPLAVAVFLRAARNGPAHERVEQIAEVILDELGLGNIVEPEDIVNTRAPSITAAECLARSARALL